MIISCISILVNLCDVGCLNSLSYSRLVSEHRCRNLVLNKYCDIEQKHTNGINCLDLDPVEKRYLLSGCSDGGVAIHDVNTNNYHTKHTCPVVHYKRRSLSFRQGGHTHSCETVQWYPLDNGLFSTSSYDKSVKIWDTNTMLVADCYNMTDVVYAHHMSSHALISVGSKDSKVFLIDIKSGSKSHTLRAHHGRVMCVQWSPRQDNILVTGSSDEHVYMWDVRSARGPIINFDRFNSSSDDGSSRHKAHSAPVTGLTFTTDGLHLLSFGCDYQIRLWDALTGLNTNVNYGRILNYSKRKLQFAITTNLQNHYIFVPTQHVVSVYNVFTGEKLQSSRLIGHFNDVNCTLFNESEQQLYSGGNDRNILIWSYDSVNSEEARRLTGEKESQVQLYRDEWSDEDDDNLTWEERY